MKLTDGELKEHRQKHIGHYNEAFQGEKGGTKRIRSFKSSRSCRYHFQTVQTVARSSKLRYLLSTILLPPPVPTDASTTTAPTHRMRRNQF